MPIAKALIIEDDQFARTTLAAALSMLGVEVVDAVAKAENALQTISVKLVDVAIIDIDLGPGPTGIDVAWALRENHPDIGVVFLTSFLDPRLSAAGVRPLPKGSRYLVKGELRNLTTLISVILQAKFSPLARATKLSASSELNSHQLSILRQVALGDTNSQIAASQGVSEKAIEHTLARISKLLGLARTTKQNARVQLVREFAKLAGKPLPN